MAFTAEEQAKFFNDCYGCNPNEFVQSVEDSISFKISGPSTVIMSLLSDAQHEMEYGMQESARKTLNRAKLLVDRYMNGSHVGNVSA